MALDGNDIVVVVVVVLSSLQRLRERLLLSRISRTSFYKTNQRLCEFREPVA